MTQTVRLDFPVTLYDSTSYTATLVSNGLIYLNDGSCTEATNACYQNYPLPSASAPPLLIAPFWDDLVLRAGVSQVLTDIQGVAPARVYVIEYRNVGFYNDTNSAITFQVLLHENSNEIDFEYVNLSGALGDGSSATVGIQNASATAGLMYSFEESALTSATAVRFLALVSPGDRVANTTGCAVITYPGRVINPWPAPVSFQLSVAHSDPSFSVALTPTLTGPIPPGGSVPFTVTVQSPAGAPIGASDVTTLTVTSLTPAFPLGEQTHLRTVVSSTGADFTPAGGVGSGAPGVTVVYSTTLYNHTGRSADFQLSPTGAVWPSTVQPSDTGVLAPSAGISVTVRVNVPADAPPGASDTVTISATAGITGTCGYYGSAAFTTINGHAQARHGMLTPRARHAFVDFPPTGRGYALGGADAANNRNIPIEEYDARADTWTARRTLPVGVSNVSAATLGGLIYLPGGYDGVGAQTLVQTYDPTTDGAAILSSDPLPAPRYGAGVAAVGGKMYVIGGADNLTSTQTVFEFDPARPAGSRWARKADMPTPRVFLTAATLDGRIYAVGGIRRRALADRPARGGDLRPGHRYLEPWRAAANRAGRPGGRRGRYRPALRRLPLRLRRGLVQPDGQRGALRSADRGLEPQRAPDRGAAHARRRLREQRPPARADRRLQHVRAGHGGRGRLRRRAALAHADPARRRAHLHAGAHDPAHRDGHRDPRGHPVQRELQRRASGRLLLHAGAVPGLP